MKYLTKIITIEYSQQSEDVALSRAREKLTSYSGFRDKVWSRNSFPRFITWEFW